MKNFAIALCRNVTRYQLPVTSNQFQVGVSGILRSHDGQGIDDAGRQI